MRESREALDVTVSEQGGRLRVHLGGRLDGADLNDARHAHFAVPTAKGTLVEVTIDDQELQTHGAVVLDHFCRLLEAKGARVAVEARGAALATLRSHVDAAEPDRPPARPDLIDRTALFRREMVESSIAYLTVFRRTLMATIGGVFRRGRFDWDDFFLALVRGGIGAIPLIVLISGLIGAILALQSGPFFARFGQEMLVAQLVALSVMREIGPLLTAILIAGRSGSSLAAEIGTMNVSEEVDALKVMGSDPVRVLLAPPFLGLICALPCLVIIADLVGILGGLVVGRLALDIPAGVYLDQTREAVKMRDVVGGLIKAIAYAIVIVTTAGHQGFATSGGAAGVGRRTTRSVVLCIMWIIVVDMFFTWMLYVLDL